MNVIQSEKPKIVSLILECLESVPGAESISSSMLNEDLELLGPGSPLDSIGLVTLIVDVEERVADECNANVTLASESAMSRRQSPFRTVGTFADYVSELVNDTNPNA
jgi:acyl carrier protein